LEEVDEKLEMSQQEYGEYVKFVTLLFLALEEVRHLQLMY